MLKSLNRFKVSKLKLLMLFLLLIISINSFSITFSDINNTQNAFSDLTTILILLARALRVVITMISLIIFVFSILKSVSQREFDVGTVFVNFMQIAIILTFLWNIGKFISFIYGATII